jgi:hypothetical protein
MGIHNLLGVLRIARSTCMQLDLVLVTLLILLGAMATYALDEIFGFTPRLATWLESLLD